MLKRFFSVLKNEKITFKNIKLIGSDGKNRGNILLKDALQSFDRKTHDLVLVNADPANPVCKVLEKTRESAFSKKKNSAAELLSRHKSITKDTEIGCKISEHDLDIKLKRILGFIEKQYQTQISVVKTRNNSKDDWESIMRTLQLKLTENNLVITARSSKPNKEILSIRKNK